MTELSRERLEAIKAWMSDDDLDNPGPDGFLYGGTQAVMMLDQCLGHIESLETKVERFKQALPFIRQRRCGYADMENPEPECMLCDAYSVCGEASDETR